MNKRITEAFAKGKAFIPFVTCGDPSLDVTEKIVYAMEDAGADPVSYTHLSFVCSHEDRERLYTSLGEEIPDVYVTSSVSNLLEIGHKDAGKGKTLLWLLGHLGIAAERCV